MQRKQNNIQALNWAAAAMWYVSSAEERSKVFALFLKATGFPSLLVRNIQGVRR